MRELARQAASKIAEAGKKKVAVADFIGPGEEMNELGRVLAEQFSASLALAGRGLEVADRVALKQLLRSRQRREQELVADKDLAYGAGRAMGVDVLVMGQLQTEGKSVALELWLFDVAAVRSLAELKTTIPRTPAVDELLNRRMYRLGAPPPKGGMRPADLPRPNLTPPKCISCPQASYTEEARRARVNGIVLVSFTVTPEGKVEDVEVTRSVGYGLDEAAVAAVRRWRLEPARQDGKPVTHRSTAEVTFRMQGWRDATGELPRPVMRPPKCIDCPPARYTNEARQNRISGVVRLSMTVTAEGRVEDVRVVSGLGYGLDEAAVATVLKWKLEPATRDGKPIETRYTTEISFRLQ